MDISRILEYALEREYEGKRFFWDNASRLQNAEAAGAFKAIAEEEQKHIDFIAAQLAALKAAWRGREENVVVSFPLRVAPVFAKVSRAVSPMPSTDLAGANGLSATRSMRNASVPRRKQPISKRPTEAGARETSA